MLYVICLIKSNSKAVNKYRLFDTCSESTLTVDTDTLKDMLLHYDLHVVNAHMQDNNIIIKKWCRRYVGVESTRVSNGFSASFSGPKFILLAEDGHNYKIINNAGRVHHFPTWELIENTELGEVVNCRLAVNDTIKQVIKLWGLLRGTLLGWKKPEQSTNCTIITYKKKEIKTLDMYTIQKDEAFEASIETKYTNFEAKTALLCHKSTAFDYEIEGHEVRLKKYIGSNKDVILPSFITSIMTRAFWGSGISTIKLNAGLKVIGEEAFLSNRLSTVEIPSTVELIGNAAFRFNEKLFTGENKLDMTRFKLLSNKTMVLDQYVM